MVYTELEFMLYSGSPALANYSVGFGRATNIQRANKIISSGGKL